MARKMNQKLDKEIRRDERKSNLIGLGVFLTSIAMTSGIIMYYASII